MPGHVAPPVNGFCWHFGQVFFTNRSMWRTPQHCIDLRQCSCRLYHQQSAATINAIIQCGVP